MADIKYYDGLARELLGQLGRLGNFTKHPSSVGKYHEELVKGCLTSFLSARFSLRCGFAYSDDNEVSDEGDLLIIDETDPSPYFFRQGNLVVVHPRALACVIEVKTKLKKPDFLSAVSNLHSFKRIRTDRNFPVTLIFAFDGTRTALNNLDKWYREVEIRDELANYPHVVFCLNRGTLVLRPRTASRPHGHYFVMGGDEEQRKLKGLSIFLQTVRKAVESKSGIKTNPYQHAVLGNLQWSQQGLRFGIGYGINKSS